MQKKKIPLGGDLIHRQGKCLRSHTSWYPGFPLHSATKAFGGQGVDLKLGFFFVVFIFDSVSSICKHKTKIVTNFWHHASNSQSKQIDSRLAPHIVLHNFM